jgi:hypothetical protein
MGCAGAGVERGRRRCEAASAEKDRLSCSKLSCAQHTTSSTCFVQRANGDTVGFASFNMQCAGAAKPMEVKLTEPQPPNLLCDKRAKYRAVT